MRKPITTGELLDTVEVPRAILEDVITDLQEGNPVEIEDTIRWLLEEDPEA